MKRKILNLVLVLLFAIAILMPTSNSTAIADELGYASEQQEERGAFDILKTPINVTHGMTTSAYCTTPIAGTMVTWSVEDSRIATVSGDGTVTGVRPGQTLLTAQIYIPGLTTMTKTTYINVTFETNLFYIKNKNSGQYLSVGNNINNQDINVVQSKHTNVSDEDFERLWMLSIDTDGSYIITSMYNQLGKVLTIDITDAVGVENQLNVEISTSVGSTNQRFKILLNDDNCTYRIVSKCSNFSKTVAVINASCAQDANVFQYTYGTSMNDEWLFEPYTYSLNLGLNYATENALTNEGVDTLQMYPYFFNRDCANFVSQCLLASGINFEYGEEWYIYKKNNSAGLFIDYTNDENASDVLDSGWQLETIGGFLGLGASSPWISAPKFYEYWFDKNIELVYFTGSQILSSPSILSAFGPGDVVQYSSAGINNLSPSHTLYITGRNGDDLLIAAHSDDLLNIPLSEIIQGKENYTFVFFKFS